MIAHFGAVIVYLLGLCRNKCQLLDLYKIIREISKRVKKKSNFMKNICW